MFASRYMPCLNCGASLERGTLNSHVCDRERWLDYQLFQLRSEIDLFGAQLNAYLRTNKGRFEVWYAKRTRREGSH
jgi:hypothetical protein